VLYDIVLYLYLFSPALFAYIIIYYSKYISMGWDGGEGELNRGMDRWKDRVREG